MISEDPKYKPLIEELNYWPETINFVLPYGCNSQDAIEFARNCYRKNIDVVVGHEEYGTPADYNYFEVKYVQKKEEVMPGFFAWSVTLEVFYIPVTTGLLQ